MLQYQRDYRSISSRSVYQLNKEAKLSKEHIHHGPEKFTISPSLLKSPCKSCNLTTPLHQLQRLSSRHLFSSASNVRTAEKLTDIIVDCCYSTESSQNPAKSALPPISILDSSTGDPSLFLPPNEPPTLSFGRVQAALSGHEFHPVQPDLHDEPQFAEQDHPDT